MSLLEPPLFLPMLAPSIFALPLLVSRVLVAYAQGTDVVCLPEYAWVCTIQIRYTHDASFKLTLYVQMTNSLGQNPCLVTSWLWTPCNGLGNSESHVPAFIYLNPVSYIIKRLPC